MKLGPPTVNYLKAFGLDDIDIEAIENGESDCIIVPDPEEPTTLSSSESHFVLLHSDGGHRNVGRLSKTQVDDFLNVWEFDCRESCPQERPATFAVGNYDDWAGIKPNSDWYDLILEYRTAIDILAGKVPCKATAPYLYLCRHTLELQLKAIIMLGKKVMKQDHDLPSTHNLKELWDMANAIASKRNSDWGKQLTIVQQLIDGYHDADPGSFNFRYPVTKNNLPIVHKTFVHTFSQETHASKFREAYDCLNVVIVPLRFDALLRDHDSKYRDSKEQ